ncbi:putative inactivated thioredoxin/glutaredoxin [Brazilian marseillevirus]|uniref:putative inactivated thioredoxin/glutaredoxin n=1 Tax=Brazilian marseillevirus TaxID=1813599 RepID=UPI0007843F52|nr:putative inactivated thioredoxin/glutaredoxin [Brazilian marseillevirus]AMQ10895.1 putative inactivated thioredoxin/glutaredoxin [Brazilian marseillevirus]
MSSIVLFYSRHSQHSRNAIELIKTHSIPASLVCVDSQTMRSIIKNSKMYRIRGVPTLFVSDGSKLSIFEGEKVYKWLLSITRGEEEPEQNPELSFEEEGTPVGEGEEEEETEINYGPKTLKHPTGVSTKDLAMQLQREAQATLGTKYE